MSNSRIEAALQALSGRRLERLMSDLLERQGYNVDPTGTRGPDGGREALLTDESYVGILHCSVQQDDWITKAHKDAEKAVDNFEQDFDQYIFATNQDPAGAKRDRVEREITSEWGMQTIIWDFERIRNELVGNSENHDLIREHLSVNPNRPWVDVEKEVDELYGKLVERIKCREAPDGTITADSAIVAVHVIPQEAIDDHHSRYVDDLPHPPQFDKRDSFPQNRPKLKITENNRRVHSGEDRERYTTIHRDGWTEGILTALHPHTDQRTGLIQKSIDFKIVNFVKTAIESFDEAEIFPPYYVYVSLIDAADYTLDYPNKLGGPPGSEQPFGEDEIRLNRVRIDDESENIPEALRQTIDQMWRYCGWNRSINYQPIESEDNETHFEFRPYR